MPRIARRTPSEIRLLADHIRERRPFGGSVRGWMRANLDLVEDLQAGVWQPTGAPGAPPQFVQPRRWPNEDIRLALIEGGVRYQNGSLSLHTLNSELRDLRREMALAQAIGGGRSEAAVLRGSRAASRARPPYQPGLLDPGEGEPQRLPDPPRPSASRQVQVGPAPQGRGAGEGEAPGVDPEVEEMRRAMARARGRQVQPVQPVTFTHEDRRAVGTKKEGE